MQSESAILEMTRQPGEKKPDADQKNGARFANPIEAGKGSSGRAGSALSVYHDSIEKPVEQDQSEQDAADGDESKR